MSVDGAPSCRDNPVESFMYAGVGRQPLLRVKLPLSAIHNSTHHHRSPMHTILWNQKTGHWRVLDPTTGTTLYKSYTRRKDPEDHKAPLGVYDWMEQNQNG